MLYLGVISYAFIFPYKLDCHIDDIGEISAGILEKKFGMPKINQNSWKCKKKKKPHSNVIRSIIDILKLFC